jgi:hypothetical protein
LLPQLDFDLFDKIKPGEEWVYPGPDPLVTAGFWAAVGDRADIFGLLHAQATWFEVEHP